MDTILCFCSLFLVLTVVSIHFPKISSEDTNSGGFTIDLIHRDSPNSPLYNPHQKPLQQYKDAFHPPHLNHSKITETQVGANKGEYLIKISIGTPPVDVYGIYDTGSDLFWAQCQPCVNCYKQINPVFNPRSSTSYSEIPCDSQQCHLLGSVSCSSQSPSVCNYSYGYGDSSLTQGVLAKEKVTFSSTSGQPVSFQMVFGCGHNNSGVFEEHEMGLIGMGGGAISIISQLGSSFGGKKFSQCLVPFGTDPSITSKLSFGSGSEVTEGGSFSTPMVTKQDPKYFVTLKGISVGDKFLPYDSTQNATQGNVFIDSGTPPTLLPKDFYNRLETEVKNAIPMAPITGDPNLGTQLCYRSKTNINAPILTAHFEGDASVQLTSIQTFIPPKKEVYCFAMQPIDGDTGVLGNFVQTNFLIGFDLDKRTVSFKATDCAKNN